MELKSLRAAILRGCKYLSRTGHCSNGYYYCIAGREDCEYYCYGDACELDQKCRYAVPYCLHCPEIEPEGPRDWLEDALNRDPLEWFPAGKDRYLQS